MLVPKTLRKENNDRPLRPKTGVKSDKSTCHFSWADFECEEETYERRLRVDADSNEDFVAELKNMVDHDGRVWCPDLEVWYVSESYKETVIELAHKHFEVVKRDLRKWTS